MKFKEMLDKLLDAPIANEDDVDPKELAMGIKVEYEHSTDRDTAKKIALAHLREIKDYYTRLKKMESEAEKA